MRTIGRKIGLAPGLGIAYHNSAVQVCPNGDLVAAYYDSPKEEDDPDQTILTMRLLLLREVSSEIGEALHNLVAVTR